MFGVARRNCMANKMLADLRRDVSEALIAAGFRRVDRVHTISLPDGFALWVDTGPIGSRPDVAPFVGIRHQGVEELRAALLNTNVVPSAGTVGANVGYVLGIGYRSWEPPSETHEVLPVINAALEKLRGFATLDGLVNAWDLEGAKRPGWQYSRIAAELLNQNWPAARRDLDIARLELCRHKDEVCDQFNSFAGRVLERFGGKIK